MLQLFHRILYIFSDCLFYYVVYFIIFIFILFCFIVHFN